MDEIKGKCEHCGKIFRSGDTTHYCPTTSEHYKIAEDDSSGSFLVSMALGAALDNGIVGGLLGGDIAGGLAGDLLNDGGLF